jgi:hypothetical protein
MDCISIWKGKKKNLKEFLQKELIFNLVEDFNEWFVRKENKKLQLLSKF